VVQGPPEHYKALFKASMECWHWDNMGTTAPGSKNIEKCQKNQKLSQFFVNQDACDGLRIESASAIIHME
jgi:hypothetical protein